MSKMRNRNGYGTIVKLSGKRRKPFEVRVNTRMDSRNYPVYDVLGRYSDRMEAQNALAAYNINPYDIEHSKLTFSQLYKLWFDSKYYPGHSFSVSSVNCIKAAYKHCEALYNMPISKLKVDHFQSVLDQDLSHATLEHIKILFNQMFEYATKYDYIKKNYTLYARIRKQDDDEHGVAFTSSELSQLWSCYASGVPGAALVLILIYSGWRIQEFATCVIDLEARTMQGGSKTKAGKDRIIPIHSQIFPLLVSSGASLQHKSTTEYNKIMLEVCQAAGIEKHTCHDCRHTFASLLSSAGVPEICIKRLLGHANKDITGLYTHKEVEELRREIEKI